MPDDAPLAAPPGPELDPADPYAREAQTFPRLSEDMVARARAYGREETLAGGTLVFERGQRSVDFFLVLDGAIEIFDADEDGRPNVFTVHGPRQFTGELDVRSGSVKRVASGVGEGPVVGAAVHQFLAPGVA
jgi:thioredoxin reductase (NADPH)